MAYPGDLAKALASPQGSPVAAPNRFAGVMPALATLPPSEGPRLVPGQPQQIASGGLAGMGGAPAGDPALQYGPGGLLARAMVTSTLSGNLPVLRPIDALKGRVNMKDLRTAAREIGGKK